VAQKSGCSTSPEAPGAVRTSDKERMAREAFVIKGTINNKILTSIFAGKQFNRAHSPVSRRQDTTSRTDFELRRYFRAIPPDSMWYFPALLQVVSDYSVFHRPRYFTIRSFYSRDAGPAYSISGV